MPSQQDWQRQLDASIRRMQEALARGAGPHGRLVDDMVAAIGAHALDRVNHKLQRKLDRSRRRQERRRLRRENQEQASRPVGFVMAGAAVVMLIRALTQPNQWWMVFIALGLAMGSASRLGARRQPASLPAGQGEGEGQRDEAAQRRAPQASAPSLPASPAVAQIEQRLARVEAVCAKLAAALKEAPAAVRDFVQKPEETVKALRAACHELARRERELRAAITEDDDERLRQERADLERRIAGERDEVVRARLGAALKSLDAQLAQRAELATAALRFEAEGTRILYSLENLHTQVLRARSADAASADVAGAGLRRSLEQISQEVDAVADALETVNREEPAPGVTGVQEVGGGQVGGGPTRERA